LGTHFWALIIGNDNYPSAPYAPGLGGCINDAHLVKDYLEEYLHVPEDHIILLENARRNEIKKPSRDKEACRQKTVRNELDPDASVTRWKI
jgi:hypothetical protein